jgi:hypothetical protein
MTRKRNDNSPETEPKSELKNPDRRHLLGAAALAAFTVGQAGSAAADPPVCWADPADPQSLPLGSHGVKENPDAHPKGYMDPSSFDPLPSGKVIFHDAKAYRQKVTDYAKKLRVAMNLDTDFTHIVRLQHVQPSGSAKSADCGCGCS